MVSPRVTTNKVSKKRKVKKSLEIFLQYRKQKMTDVSAQYTNNKPIFQKYTNNIEKEWTEQFSQKAETLRF